MKARRVSRVWQARSVMPIIDLQSLLSQWHECVGSGRILNHQSDDHPYGPRDGIGHDHAIEDRPCRLQSAGAPKEEQRPLDEPSEEHGEPEYVAGEARRDTQSPRVEPEPQEAGAQDEATHHEGRTGDEVEDVRGVYFTIGYYIMVFKLVLSLVI